MTDEAATLYDWTLVLFWKTVNKQSKNLFPEDAEYNNLALFFWLPPMSLKYYYSVNKVTNWQ